MVVYSMGVSLDGYIAGPGDDISWTAPDEELHRFHNEQGRHTDVEVYGRRLYETMRYWETAEPDPSSPEDEWARIWKDMRRLVVSRTLDEVHGGAELVRGDLASTIASLDGQVAIGGAGLAASCLELGLVDELRPLVYPVTVGGGTPYLPPLPLHLRLLETRTFESGVVYLRYAIVR
jgi:dihydrofolate reductase